MEWKAHVDEASGETYYYNTVSGLTTWERPEGFASDDAMERIKGGVWGAFNKVANAAAKVRAATLC